MEGREWACHAPFIVEYDQMRGNLPRDNADEPDPESEEATGREDPYVIFLYIMS